LYDGEWSCPANRSLTKRSPIVVFSNHRSGSNFLSDLINRAGRFSVDDVDMLQLYELFVADSMGYVRIASKMTEVCNADGLTNEDRKEWVTQMKEIVKPFAKIATMSEEVRTEWSRRLYQVIEEAQPDPAGLLRFLHNIPSSSPKSFFAFKIFHGQLNSLAGTTQDFVNSVLQLSTADIKPTFMVLWRRNFLESYVSLKVAQKYNTWTGKGTDETQTITIDRSGLERYISEESKYYAEVRDTLVAANAQFAVIEYSRDLQSSEGHLRTMVRLAKMMGASDTSEQLESILLNHIKRTKQSKVPVQSQIDNWEEVASWGYTGNLEDFADIFQDVEIA